MVYNVCNSGRAALISDPPILHHEQLTATSKLGARQSSRTLMGKRLVNATQFLGNADLIIIPDCDKIPKVMSFRTLAEERLAQVRPADNVINDYKEN